MMMVRFDMERGGDIPMHSHPHEQVGFLIEGRGVLVSESDERPVVAGDTWSMAGGVVHGARFGDSPAVVIEVFSPPREDYR
jgi:unsaturated pyranuronate lyase